MKCIHEHEAYIYYIPGTKNPTKKIKKDPCQVKVVCSIVPSQDPIDPIILNYLNRY